MSGWICLHRSIQDHWIFNNAEYFRAWVDLLMLANHETKTFLLKNQLVTIERGQVGYSQVELAKRWKWPHRDRVKRYLEKLKNDGMIEFKTTHLNTVISICNYSKYQDLHAADPAADPASNPTSNPTADPTANPTQTTIKQINNVNKETITTSYVETETVSGEENVISIEKNKKPSPPYKEIVDLYHATLPTLAQVYKLTETRKSNIKSLWADELDSIGSWKSYFHHILKSDFLMGRLVPGPNGRRFVADFDFVIKPGNFVKIAEEKYHAKKVSR